MFIVKLLNTGGKNIEMFIVKLRSAGDLNMETLIVKKLKYIKYERVFNDDIKTLQLFRFFIEWILPHRLNY